MSEFIMDKVKILRQKNHDDRVTEVISKLHSESIDMLQDDIIEEANKLENYNYKEWRRRPNIKREKVKFMLEKNHVVLGSTSHRTSAIHAALGC